MNVPQQKEEVIFTSFLISLVVSFLIVLLPHVGGGNSQRTYMPKSSGSSSQGFNSTFNYYTYSDAVEWGSFKCVLGNIHSIDTSGMTIGDFMSAELGFDQIMKSAFEHFGLMAIIAVVLTAIISILRLHENDQNKFEEIK